jgi:hypothetical protein
MVFNTTRALFRSIRRPAERESPPHSHDGVRLEASDGDGRFLRRGPLGFLLAFVLSALLIANLRAQGTQNSVKVPGDLSLLLKAKGEGVQIYGCVNETWQLQAPVADLLDDERRVIGSHYSGPTWQLKDGSVVKGTVVSIQVSPDAASIPWLLIKSVEGTGKLKAVQFIQRSETHGGAAPSENCSNAAIIRVPYTATYSFYGKAQ